MITQQEYNTIITGVYVISKNIPYLLCGWCGNRNNIVTKFDAPVPLSKPFTPAIRCKNYNEYLLYANNEQYCITWADW